MLLSFQRVASRVQQSPNVDGMLVVDGECVVRFANPAAERLGRSAGALEGARLGFPLVAGEASEIDVVTGGAPRTVEMRVVGIDWESVRVSCLA